MQAADEFYKNDFGDRQFFLFGDTDHSDYRVHDYFYSDEHLDRLAALGVKHIFIERMPSKSQQGIDDLVSGKITPEKFAKDYAGGKLWDRDGAEGARARMAKGVVYAASLGMKIHASDVKTKGIATKEERNELYGFYGAMSQEFNKLCPGATNITGKFQQYYAEKRSDYLEKWGARFNEIMQERYSDKNRLDYIKSIAKNERSALLYGDAHFMGPNSFRGLLGAAKSVYTKLFPSESKVVQYGSSIKTSDFAQVIDQKYVYKVGKFDFKAGLKNKLPDLKP